MQDTSSLLQQAISSHQIGDFATAAKGYASVLTEDPKNADAWHLAGLLAYQNGSPADGIRQIRLAIDLNPHDPEYHSNLAGIMNAIGQPAAAIEAANQAIQLDPDFLPGKFQKAKALSNQHEFYLATIVFEDLLNAGFDEVKIRLELSNIAQMDGRMLEAIEQLRIILRKSPGNPHACLELSKFVSTGLFKFNDSQINTLRRLANEPGHLSSRDRSRIYVALAADCQNKRQYDSAFKFHEFANQCMADFHHKHAGLKFEPEEDIAFTDRMIKNFSAEKVNFFREFGRPTHLPVFIVGMPRSGTTLVHQLLTNHPSIAGLGELSLIPDLFASVTKNGGKLLHGQVGESANRYLQQAEALIDDPDIIRAVDKLPGNYSMLGFIKILFPQCKIIHCVRDPRDTCLSCFFTLFKNPDLQLGTSSLENVLVLYKSYRRLMKHWNSFLADDIYEVNYTRVVTKTRSEMTGLINFLSLPFHENCAEVDSKNKTVVKTASIVQARQPIYNSSLNRWRHYEHQLDFLCRELKDEVDAFEASL